MHTYPRTSEPAPVPLPYALVLLSCCVAVLRFTNSGTSTAPSPTTRAPSRSNRITPSACAPDACVDNDANIRVTNDSHALQCHDVTHVHRILLLEVTVFPFISAIIRLGLTHDFIAFVHAQSYPYWHFHRFIGAAAHYNRGISYDRSGKLELVGRTSACIYIFNLVQIFATIA